MQDGNIIAQSRSENRGFTLKVLIVFFVCPFCYIMFNPKIVDVLGDFEL